MTFLLLTNVSNKATLAQVFCIHYLMQFRKDNNKIQALLDSGSKVNIMNFAYTKKLGFRIRKTNIGAQKIDSSSLNTLRIIITSFQN